MKTKYFFTLTDVYTKKINKRFGFICNDNTQQNITKISDLTLSRNMPDVVSFVDDAKKSYKCTISMIDFNTNIDISNYLSVHDCFWCRNQIPETVMAIGCPIKYIPNQAIKTYYSEISKDTYTIKENITKKRGDDIINSSDNRLCVKNRDYYLTDGIFCSFNCCMAYIEDNKYDSLYNKSGMLLLKMYHDIYPVKVTSIDTAPHWRKLIQHGGNLTIDKFRDSFNKIEYKNHGIINELPTFKSIGVLFEEKLKF